MKRTLDGKVKEVEEQISLKRKGSAASFGRGEQILSFPSLLSYVT